MWDEMEDGVEDLDRKNAKDSFGTGNSSGTPWYASSLAEICDEMNNTTLNKSSSCK